MNFGKNLTGEQKGTFRSLDITQSLNIDDNASIVSSGTSGSICAVHGDFYDLYCESFNYSNASFKYVEFTKLWSGVTSVSNLSFINRSFTTLYNVSSRTFSYISTLTSIAQTQIDNVSGLALNLSEVVSNVSTTVNSAI